MTIRLTAPICAALALAVALAGCGSTKTTTVTAPAPTTSAATTPATSASATTTSSGSGSGEPVTVKGKTGDTLILTGAGLNTDPNNHAKTKIKLTVTGLSGPFKGYDNAAGHELIGVKMRFENLGKLHYDDPQPDGTLVLTTGETGKQTELIQAEGKDP